MACLHPSLKLDLMSSFWKVWKKVRHGPLLFSFTADLLALFLMFSLVLCSLWIVNKNSPIYHVVGFFINVIERNVSYIYQKLTKNQAVMLISGAISMVTEKKRTKEGEAG